MYILQHRQMSTFTFKRILKYEGYLLIVEWRPFGQGPHLILPLRSGKPHCHTQKIQIHGAEKLHLHRQKHGGGIQIPELKAHSKVLKIQRRTQVESSPVRLLVVLQRALNVPLHVDGQLGHWKLRMTSGTEGKDTQRPSRVLVKLETRELAYTGARHHGVSRLDLKSPKMELGLEQTQMRPVDSSFVDVIHTP